MTTIDSALDQPSEADVAAVRELIELERDPATPHATLTIGPYAAFVLVGALQLTLRHPLLYPDQREQITSIARQVQTLYQGRAYELLEHGFDPAKDSDWHTSRLGQPGAPA
jgi:hypothetical protein